MMPDPPGVKPVIWVGSSRRDLREFPEPVQDHMGYALFVAKRGGKHPDAKPLAGFGGAGVVEIVKTRHLPGHLHRASCGYCLRAARISEEIKSWPDDAKSRDRPDHTTVA
jgi:phage-related protein